jgi:PAS domain S-box-containing protein
MGGPSNSPVSGKLALACMSYWVGLPRDFEPERADPYMVRPDDERVDSKHRMSLALDGYRNLRAIRTSATTRIYAGERDDGLPIIAKVHAIVGRPGVEARVEHEFALIRGLQCEGVVRALALEPVGDLLVLVLERHAGVDLAEYAGGRPMALVEFLRIASQLAEILARVHAQSVIHRDIKPANILIDPATGRVALADFGISVLLESERASIHDPRMVAGTLPYVSPEQTGRTGREVDFRSDLYSLGVTFFELLTGRRPFVSSSPLELIHAHLARRPESPQRLRPELPNVIAALVVKLLEKAPERRYQSARGLAHDLAAIADATARGLPLDAIELGRHDLPSAIQLPHHLFGREAQIEQLHAEFRAASTGQPRLVLLEGPPGIGKSALLGELIGPVLGHRGMLIRGKFDPGAQQPFAGIVVALEALADQLLTNDDAMLRTWRADLERELGGLSGIVRELVPKFAAVLEPSATRPGSGPVEPTRLNAAEQRARTRLALSRVLLRMARVEHPLVLALDDLHWADAASLELIGNLLAEPAVALLVAATTREPAPLVEMLARVRSYSTPVTVLELGPLSSEALAGMIAAMLARADAEPTELVSLVARKTSSNPLFVRQFLLHLVERGLLRQRADSAGVARWTWDEAELEAASLPADSLAMMTSKLAALPESLVELAVVASVIGSRFEGALVEPIVGRPIVGDLHRLVDEGLIAPQGGMWVFGHDRIREAAYQSLSPERARELHRQVAEQLFRRRSSATVVVDGELDEQLTEQLDRGHGLLPLFGIAEAIGEDDVARVLAELDGAELAKLIELNFRTGVRVLGAGAPKSAVRLLELAAAALTRSGAAELEREYGFSLELALGEALAMSGEHARADDRFLALLEREWSIEQYASLVIERHWLLTLRGDVRAAYAFGCRSLAWLGMPMPAHVGKLAMARATLWLIRHMRISKLANICRPPRHDDPEVKAALAVATAMLPSSYLCGPEAYLVLLVRVVDHMLRHGDHGAGPLIAAQLAMLFAIGFEQQSLATELLALESSAPGVASYEHRRRLSAGMVLQWRLPYRECIEGFREAREIALEAGDLESADYCEVIQLSLALHGGLHLRVVAQQAELSRRRRSQWGTGDLGGSPQVIARFCQRLLEGPLPGAGELDPLGAEGESEVAWIEPRLLGAILLVLAGHWHDVLGVLDELVPAAQRTLRGTWLVVVALALHGLAAGALARTDPSRRSSLVRLLRRTHARLDRWARKGGNCRAHADLLRGELRALEGSFEGALAAYESAVEHARTAKTPLWEALACERMAELADRHGHRTMIGGPLERARERYRRWGAVAKVAALEQRWPELGPEAGRIDPDDTNRPPTPNTRTPTTSNTKLDGTVDMVALFQTSQAIAGALRLDDVVARVMHIALQTAGAERAALVLPSDEGLMLAAECSADQDGEAAFTRMPLADAGTRVPISLLRWVERTREPLVLAELGEDLRFANDLYVRTSGARSILCRPIIEHGRLAGLLYLENKLSAGTFTGDRLEVLGLLMGQAASALENARLYEALRTSEVRWRSLVERMPDLVVVVDRRGDIEFVNHLDEGAIGAERIGEPLLDAIATDQSERARECLDDALGGQTREVELEFAGSSARRRVWAVRFAPIAVDGQVERVIVVASEVTKRRELEQQLRQQQRLESIGTLASGVAHEINNPVQGIMNYAELIARASGADTEIREFADEIERETKRVSTIVRKLLAFSRQEPGTIEPTTVDAIIEGTLSLIRVILRHDRIGLNVDVPADLPHLECAPQQIQQVIMNLVTNARDALDSRFAGDHPDKSIDIVARSFEREGATWLRISVADRGGGIAQDMVGRIFDPFFTTKGRDRGTGLGLAVSHGIVQEHGGELRLDNRPGEGATFHVELPRVRSSPIA